MGVLIQMSQYRNLSGRLAHTFLTVILTAAETLRTWRRIVDSNFHHLH